MHHAAIVISATIIAAAPAAADTDALIDRYYKALNMNEVFEILHDEGVASAIEMAQEDEGISLSPAWTSRVESIYAIDKMDAAFRSGLTQSRSIEASEKAIAFFEGDLGSRIVDIELSARRALDDDAIEDAAREKAETMREEDPDRLALYNQFIAVNDLIDSNVTGALNANLAFYQGFGSNPLFGGMDERSMLAQVYGQETEIREGMEDWTMNFSVLAYSILTDEEVEQYIEVSDTQAGRLLNTALFAGFDKVFQLQSFELGRAMAEFMVGDDT